MFISSIFVAIIIVVNVILWSAVAILIGGCYYMQMRKSKEEKISMPNSLQPYPAQYNRGLTSFSPSGDSSWALAPL